MGTMDLVWSGEFLGRIPAALQCGMCFDLSSPILPIGKE